MISNMLSGYREELIATSLVLGLSVTGTFYMAHRYLTPTQITPAETGSNQGDGQKDKGVILGEKDSTISQITTATPTLLPTDSPIPTASTPTTSPQMTEVFYGEGGLYEYESYRLEIKSPRIVFDVQKMSERKFVVDVVLTNYSVTGGLANALTVSIEKDGNLIVPSAALSLSENRMVKIGETMHYQAKISLIEGTDVRELIFKPAQLTESKHLLSP